MQLILDPNTNGYTINAVDPGQFTINHNVYSTSLIVTPKQLITPWGTNLDTLNPTQLQTLIDLRPQLILLGVGPCFQLLPPALLEVLYASKIGFEYMDTRAACRTYNLLASEGRQVAAGLLLP